MDTHTEAQIFVADQRGYTDSNGAQRLFTFNAAGYTADGREPFGPLVWLNDERLAPAASLTAPVEEAVTAVLLPLIGGLEYQLDENTQFLEPGQSGTLSLAAGQTYRLTNPYEAETIQFLHLGLHAETATTAPTAFDLSESNQLLPFWREGAQAGYIGRFDGRHDATVAIEAAEQRVFVYIVQGAFEVANRLLHTGDGLALHYRQADVLEFEALSNNAMLILLML
ncbi:pirin [Fibrella sp. WM1]|uniref:pirin family protein n=1 Tax=Fibrella musci TaxID=3242485 RepID=UPI003521B823